MGFLNLFHDFEDIIQELFDAILPSPHTLERDTDRFVTVLSRLQRYSTDRKRSLADLAADADMAATWTRIRDRISARARDFHGVEEYIQARREGNFYKWLSTLKSVRKARRHIILETYELEDLLSRARKQRINQAEALFKKYGPMQTLLDHEDELTAQIDTLESKLTVKIAEINAFTDEMADFPVTEKDMKDFYAQNKVDVAKLDAEIQVLWDQRTVLTRRIDKFEVARRRLLGWSEEPKPQQDEVTV